MEIFNQEEQEQVVQAISLAENHTSGEIRLVVERRTGNEEPYEKAKSYFEKLNMHNTALRNGVLIYLATDDHQFAIIGDAGIDAKVPSDFWESTKDQMLLHFREGAFVQGLLAGIENAGNQLATYFPRREDDVNELPNDIYFGK